MLEISKLVPRLIRDFEFSLDKSAYTDGNWKTEGLWFVKPKGFKVRAEVRKYSRSG